MFLHLHFLSLSWASPVIVKFHQAAIDWLFFPPSAAKRHVTTNWPLPCKQFTASVLGLVLFATKIPFGWVLASSGFESLLVCLSVSYYSGVFWRDYANLQGDVWRLKNCFAVTGADSERMVCLTASWSNLCKQVIDNKLDSRQCIVKPGFRQQAFQNGQRKSNLGVLVVISLKEKGPLV